MKIDNSENVLSFLNDYINEYNYFNIFNELNLINQLQSNEFNEELWTLNDEEDLFRNLFDQISNQEESYDINNTELPSTPTSKRKSDELIRD